MSLKNSPTFQRLMNNVLCNLVGLKCLVYSVDIIKFISRCTGTQNKIAGNIQSITNAQFEVTTCKV